MKRVALGSSDLSVSVVGLGGLHFGVFLNEDEARHLVHQAVDLGINFIDTAPLYGNGQSEAYIGRAIAGIRKKIFLTTKVGLRRVDTDGRFSVTVDPLNETNIRKSLEKSLKALGTDYLDLYQLHAFDERVPIEETLEVLQKLMNEGKIRSAGCSNFNGQEFQKAMESAEKFGRPGFASCQTHYNLLERRAEAELIPACRRWKTPVFCNRALARGILSGKYPPGGSLPVNSRAQFSERLRNCLSEKTLLVTQALKFFAEDRGHTATELAIAWLFSSGHVDGVLAGARDIDQMKEWIRGADWHLSAGEKESVQKILESFSLTTALRQMPRRFLEVG
jgi:aryl-alcohol dehydrogenase-like predicted oxidoreductase